jgi:hypothetical protein
VIKSSTNADDFRAYLKKFPNGTFADLANNRLKVLEKDEETKRKADELAKQTKSFKGPYSTLVISPVKIEWLLPDGKRSDPLECSSLRKARLEKSAIRDMCLDRPCQFIAESAADAASAFEAIREVCKSSAQVIPTDESRSGSLEGTIWKGASPGGDKQYEFQFLPGGLYRGKATVGKYVFQDTGTWKRVGNTVSIDSVIEGFPDKRYHTEATINQDTMKGSSPGGKYKFTMREIQ